MNDRYLCKAPGRIDALRAAALLSPPRLVNGIHFLEVSPDQRRLYVHFVHPLTLAPADALTTANVEIRGGVRVRDPAVTSVSSNEHMLSVEVATAGDFSRYVLRLVASAGGAVPPPGIDPALAQIVFSFKVDCHNDFDCRTDRACTTAPATAPVIDYLARDYAGFRRLILDRLSTLMPDWDERNPADLLVTLAEAMAFRGDELAYFQDAVATEAYLGTARQRVSVRRHTRLLDYAFHDGRSARAWVAFEVKSSADGQTLKACDPDTGIGGTLLLTTVPDFGKAISPENAKTALEAGAQPFELLTPVTLYNAHNAIDFYTWNDDECCLPKGATSAFLRDDAAHRLQLRAGDVLVLEARLSTTNGMKADADHQQRHAVRLTRVDPEAPLVDGVRDTPAPRLDPVTDAAFVEITWDYADALPFPLCLSKRIGGVLYSDMAGATGNVALADHGFTAPSDEEPAALPGGRLSRYSLESTALAPLTQQGRVRVSDHETTVLVDAGASASAALQCDLADVRPALEVISTGDRRRWRVQRDLLASDEESAEFVVETENDGHAVLRFGDGVNGRAPRAGETLQVRVRTGNGAAGNVGAESIGHVVTSLEITSVRNPLPAAGGTDPLSPARAKMYAPQAFRRQERAVTPDDYAVMMECEPRIQRAVATRRWTGSWYTTFITVDRRGGGALDPGFEAELVTFIERYRLAGHDVEIDAPRYVALDIELRVCTQPGYFAADVESRLVETFSAGMLANGKPGFFHPDRFTFGQPVYLSAVIAATMQVPGVAYVTAARFQRLGRNPAGEIAAGRIDMNRLEIARLDNDPNAPEYGRLRLDVATGV